MRLAFIIILMVLPGSWLAFSPGSAHWSYSTRFSLSIVFSPLITVIQFYGLRLAGLTFQQVVPTLQLLNLGSLFLIIRAFRHSRPRIVWHRVLLGGIVYASVAACVAIPWLWEPDFRRFSWHGLLHTDIVYAFARGALIPEDPELVGVTLAYPWIGHLYWSLLGWSADLSPTVIYIVSNLVLLAATGVLSYSVARELGASEITSFAVPMVLALGTNVPGLIGWSIIPPNDNGVWWAILGDLRYAPFLLKFVTFEPMTFGLALYTSLVFICVAALRHHTSLDLRLGPVVVAAIGAIYPNLFPAAALLLGGLIATFFLGHRYLDRDYTLRSLVGFLILAGLAAVLGVLCVEFYTSSRASGALALSSLAALAKKTVAAGLAFAPFAAGMYWMWQSEPVRRRAPLLTLLIGAGGAVVLNVLLRIGGGLNEYKFFFAAGICLAAPAMIGFERTLFRTQKNRWVILTILPIILMLVMTSYSVNRIPRHGSDPLNAREGSFWLGLGPGEADAAWTDIVRTQSPWNTILLVNHPNFHTTSFTARQLLVPSEGEKYHFGYNMPSRYNMVVERGYDRELFEGRYELLRKIYSTQSSSEMSSLLRQLMSFRRPITIIFSPHEGEQFLGWLRSEQIGSELFRDDEGRVIYQIPSRVSREDFAGISRMAAQH